MLNKFFFIPMILLLSACASNIQPQKPEVSKIVTPLPDLPKPTLDNVQIGYSNNHYIVDKKNVKILYHNYRNLIDYSLQERSQLKYYKNMLKK